MVKQYRAAGTGGANIFPRTRFGGVVDGGPQTAAGVSRPVPGGGGGVKGGGGGSPGPAPYPPAYPEWGLSSIVPAVGRHESPLERALNEVQRLLAVENMGSV